MVSAEIVTLLPALLIFATMEAAEVALVISCRICDASCVKAERTPFTVSFTSERSCEAVAVIELLKPFFASDNSARSCDAVWVIVVFKPFFVSDTSARI